MTDDSRFAPISTRQVPRFAGISTFLRLPLHADPSDVDALICGVPFDGGTTFRPGARFGPRAVREASALSRGFHLEQGVDLFTELRCADGGDVLCVPMDIAGTLQNIRVRVAEIAACETLPVLIGGDHTITLGALRAVAAQHGPVGLVHFDAHSDTFGPAWGVDVHHGTVFRHAFQEQLVRPSDVLQIGIRGPLTSANDLDAARGYGFRIITIDEVKDDLASVGRAIAALRDRGPVYVSFDMDALDPAYAPGTGTPVPGGLTSHEALRLLRSLRGLSVVGCDVVEISPDHDLTGNTALLATSVLSEMLAAVAATTRDAR